MSCNIFRLENVEPENMINLMDYFQGRAEGFSNRFGDVVVNPDWNDTRAQLYYALNERTLVGQVTLIPEGKKCDSVVEEIKESLKL